jgi:hypothetical protein
MMLPVMGGHHVACHFADRVTPEAAADASEVVVPVGLEAAGVAEDAPVTSIAGADVAIGDEAPATTPEP